MLQFVYDQDEAIKSVAEQVMPNDGRRFGNCKTIGVIDDETGELQAGFIYHHYIPKAQVIEVGLFILNKKAFNRKALRKVFEYPFIECGCQMIIAPISANNEALLSILARLNFDFTLVPRLYGRGEDAVLCTLTDDQWLDSKFSKRMYRSSAVEEAA